MIKKYLQALTGFLLFALAACVTTSGGSLTPAQRLYEAHGNYNVALGVAVAYSESSVASPAVVHRLRQANDVAAPAFSYAAAYVACSGAASSTNPAVMMANAQCAGLDLSPEAIQRNSTMLVSAAQQIRSLLRAGR